MRRVYRHISRRQPYEKTKKTQRRRLGDGAAARRFFLGSAPVKLFEFEFYNCQVPKKRAWGADVYEALSSLGFNNPEKALGGAIIGYTIIAEVIA